MSLSNEEKEIYKKMGDNLGKIRGDYSQADISKIISMKASNYNTIECGRGERHLKDIQIINNGYEWVIWYYNLIIGKMYHVVVSKRCMKECLRFCLDEIIVSPKDLMIYDGATDIAFLGTKKRQ